MHKKGRKLSKFVLVTQCEAGLDKYAFPVYVNFMLKNHAFGDSINTLRIHR